MPLTDAPAIPDPTCSSSTFDQNHHGYHPGPPPPPVRTTAAVFAEYDFGLPADEDLEALTELAQSAATLYWAAARYDPDPAKIEFFVSFFIWLCSARPTLQ